MIGTTLGHDRMRLVLAFACLTAACAASASMAGQAAERPNLVLIYIDDMGWRDLAVMGSAYYETPHIDRLAREGMLFTNAYANAPNCAPSRAALLSGQYGPRTGIYTVGSAARGQAENRRLVPVENRTTLDLGVVTLAESLRAAGYATGHAGKWHLGGAGHLPADQGFDWSVAGDAGGSPPGYFYPYVRGQRSLPGLEPGTEGEYLADRLTDEAIGFIATPRDKPFFLYLSHYSVHTPTQGKPELIEHYRGKAGSNGQDNPTYAAMVQSVDEGVGRLLAALDDTGLADNTLVIFTSDNGGFGPVTSMAPLRGSKGMLYEGGIREPLIVRWPGRVAPGSTSDTPAIATDLYPTLLEVAGGTLPENQILDGTSLVPLLTGDDRVLAPRPLFWHFPAYLERDASVERGQPWRTTPVSGVRVGRYKLLWFFEDSRAELYDLDSDLSESHDLAREMPDKAAELQAVLTAWWAETRAFLPSERTQR